MSRYLLLVLLNTPFIFAGMVSAFINFKLGRSSLKRLALLISFWAIVFIGLLFSEAIYNYLFSNNLTDTEPLSLFDVVQITAIVIVMYIAGRTRARLDRLEKRVQDIHQELSIRLSDTNSTVNRRGKK